MPRYELINLRGEVADIVNIDAETIDDALRLAKSGSHRDSDYEIVTVDGEPYDYDDLDFESDTED